MLRRSKADCRSKQSIDYVTHRSPNASSMVQWFTVLFYASKEQLKYKAGGVGLVGLFCRASFEAVLIELSIWLGHALQQAHLDVTDRLALMMLSTHLWRTGSVQVG